MEELLGELVKAGLIEDVGPGVKWCRGSVPSEPGTAGGTWCCRRPALETCYGLKAVRARRRLSPRMSIHRDNVTGSRPGVPNGYVSRRSGAPMSLRRMGIPDEGFGPGCLLSRAGSARSARLTA